MIDKEFLVEREKELIDKIEKHNLFLNQLIGALSAIRDLMNCKNEQNLEENQNGES